eukprot:763443-Hanusia_phi.AAC.2
MDPITESRLLPVPFIRERKGLCTAVYPAAHTQNVGSVVPALETVPVRHGLHTLPRSTSNVVTFSP